MQEHCNSLIIDMKHSKHFFIFLFLVLCINFKNKAQNNLVLNYSFEDTITCPEVESGSTFIVYTPPWFSPTNGTPDLFNECSNQLNGVPNSSCGFQYARTGKGFGGFGWDYSINCEYLTGKFSSPLISNKKYCIEFYVNLANYSYYAYDRIGAYISVDSLHIPTYGYLHFIPQIENPVGNIITDTLNWSIISGQFIASGGEKYITIGNFRPDSIVHTLINDTIVGFYPYYYLDDVYVYYCGGDTIEHPNQLTIPNAFTPNNDGFNDFFVIQGQNIKTVSGKIINRWGQELFKWSDMNEKWDGKYEGKDVSAGVYYYIISVTFEDGEVQEKHGSLEVVR